MIAVIVILSTITLGLGGYCAWKIAVDGGFGNAAFKAKREARLNHKPVETLEQFMRSAGLSFLTFAGRTEVEDYGNGDPVKVQLWDLYPHEAIAKELNSLGFNLISSRKEWRNEYWAINGESKYQVTIDTYTKNIHGRITTVTLDEDVVILFPNQGDADEFINTAKACGMKVIDRHTLMDNQSIYWAGTTISHRRTKVTLIRRWEP